MEIDLEPQIFGYTERGGHPEVIYRNVRVPVDNLLGDEGVVSRLLGASALPDGFTTACEPSVLLNARSRSWCSDHSNARRSDRHWPTRDSSGLDR